MPPKHVQVAIASLSTAGPDDPQDSPFSVAGAAFLMAMIRYYIDSNSLR